MYVHFFPQNHRKAEGKGHATTSPAELYRYQNSKRLLHPLTKFARAWIRSLEELAAILGPAEVTFHLQDDKAKTPIGMTVASKQAPMFMHMEY